MCPPPNITLGSVLSQGEFARSCLHILHAGPCEQHHEFFRWLAGLGSSVQSRRTDFPVRVANWSGEKPMTLASLPWKIMAVALNICASSDLPCLLGLCPKWLSLVRAGLAENELGFLLPRRTLTLRYSLIVIQRFVSGFFHDSCRLPAHNSQGLCPFSITKCLSWIFLPQGPGSNLAGTGKK